MKELEHWQNTVLNYRKQKLDDGHFWEGEHAHWYYKWIRRNDYAPIIYPYIHHLVSGRVLEIGAGTGLFTGFLARDAEHVDVLEPSVDMLHYVRQDLDTARLTLLPMKIESYLPCICPCEFVLGAHSFFNIFEIDEVLQTLLNNCKNLAVLIGTGEAHSFHQMVRDHFNGDETHKKPGPPGQCHLAALLDALAIDYELELLSTPVSYFSAQKADLLKTLSGSCGLTEIDVQELEEFVTPYLKRDDKEFWYEGQRRHALFIIPGRLKD